MQNISHILQQEAQRTQPDYIVYMPKHYDGSTYDGLNEHFLVFEGPDGTLMTIWTQSAMASGLPGGRQNNHIIFAKSLDQGKTWSQPTHVVGPKNLQDPTPMASWAFPMVSRSGRIYVVYNRHQNISGWIAMHTGTMAGVYSDDGGETWTAPQDIPMPTSPYDDPSGKTPPEWIVWQKPMLDLQGNYFVGYSHWLNPAVATLKQDQIEGWTWIESVCEFMRFTNLHDNPVPKDLRIEYSGWGDKALRVPHYMHPELSVAQEPSLVRLPDNRLLCVMRTCSGYIWWSQSSDDGYTWCSPRPLLYKDFGLPLLNPVGCDPIYQLCDGRYIVFFHNNRGRTEGKTASEAKPRQPLFFSVGEFHPEADQPVWFSQPELFMDTNNTWVDGNQYAYTEPYNTSLSLYSSFTNCFEKDILWYPDRKFFLLGREITEDVLGPNNL